MTEAKSKTCNECYYACFEDFGYSNYTVEGTEFSCLLDKHPDGSFDRFYGEDKRLDYAANCLLFKAGEPVSMDVDHECLPELDEEQRKLYEAMRN